MPPFGRDFRSIYIARLDIHSQNQALSLPITNFKDYPSDWTEN